MKTIKTFASAAVLTMAAANANAVSVSVSSAADILALPGATISGVGSGDLVGGVLTYDLVSTTDLGAYGTAVVTSSGTWSEGSPGTSTASILSCSGAMIACGQVALGPQAPGVSVESPLAFGTGPGDVTVWTIAGDGVSLGDTTMTATVAAVPVPAAAWLFGSALLGLAGISRKKHS